MKNLNGTLSLFLILLLSAFCKADIADVKPVWRSGTVPLYSLEDGCMSYFERALDKAEPLISKARADIQAGAVPSDAMRDLKNWEYWVADDRSKWLIRTTLAPPEHVAKKSQFWIICYCSAEPPSEFTGWKPYRLLHRSGHWGFYNIE